MTKKEIEKQIEKAIGNVGISWYKDGTGLKITLYCDGPTFDQLWQLSKILKTRKINIETGEYCYGIGKPFVISCSNIKIEKDE